MPQRHGFLLLPRFSLLALGGAAEALHAANRLLAQPAYAPVTVSLDGRAVRAACGTLLQPAHGLADAGEMDAVHVLADLPLPELPAEQHRALHAWLQCRAGEGALLGGLGAGAAVLAAAGLLAGHRCTVHWALEAQLAEAHADVVVSGRLYEIDRGRLSAGGGGASLDLMLAWLSQRHGERLAHELAAHFGLERLRSSDERQRAPLPNRPGLPSARLAEAVALMESNLAEPLPTEDIARLVGVSRRQLERLFKQHLDALPSRYYAELRLVKARRLLQQTSQSILQIGLACGFASGSHFSNAYRGRFGHTPRDERSQRAAAWRSQEAAAAPPPAAARPAAKEAL
jgi:transcriptional regulator GlxA family with amidase domain